MLWNAVIVLGILLGLWLALVLALLVAGKRTAARELASLLPNLATLFKGLVADRRVPRGSKVLLLLALAWLISPIDLIPEFVPFLGPLDDAVVAALVLRRILKTAGEDVVRQHWRGDDRTLDTILRLSGAKPRGPVLSPPTARSPGARRSRTRREAR